MSKRSDALARQARSTSPPCVNMPDEIAKQTGELLAAAEKRIADVVASYPKRLGGHLPEMVLQAIEAVYDAILTIAPAWLGTEANLRAHITTDPAVIASLPAMWREQEREQPVGYLAWFPIEEIASLHRRADPEPVPQGPVVPMFETITGRFGFFKPWLWRKNFIEISREVVSSQDAATYHIPRGFPQSPRWAKIKTRSK